MTVTLPFCYKQPVEMNNSRNNCMTSCKDSLVDLFIFCLTLLMSAGFFMENWFKLKNISFLKMQTQVSVIQPDGQLWTTSVAASTFLKYQQHMKYACNVFLSAAGCKTQKLTLKLEKITKYIRHHPERHMNVRTKQSQSLVAEKFQAAGQPADQQCQLLC